MERRAPRQFSAAVRAAAPGENKTEAADRAAKVLGVTRSYVLLLMDPELDRSPGIALGARIEDLYGVPIRLWADGAAVADGEAA